MATQSLYRRYRPRRFAEIKGQEHVVRALRDSVASGREGQAYLFSGPRGTGKTTSARVLAKVLNCEHPVDGEPCCACPSCLDVERGTSYDVHELDAASNNGVEAMRDLIEKAQLGTPGRHKVYILDEVHMLSKPAEAALLKTLEEPPGHVVFVLATTDPQKVSDTIRSRTQHLRFHLLAPDVLTEHVRWVAADAGLTIDDEAVAAAVSQGSGSARDALSALELIANSGGTVADALRFDDLVDALAEHDTGQALTAVARLVNAGHDPRTVAEEFVKHLRNGFLAMMAPQLVPLPASAVDSLAAQAQRLGAPALVGAMERLGQTLVELRHAPDPRVLVEVALVQLTRPPAEVTGAVDTAALAARVARLEQAVASRGAGPGAAPVDPVTGRAQLGGRARLGGRAVPAAETTPAEATGEAIRAGTAADAARAGTARSSPAGGGRPTRPARPASPSRPAPPAEAPVTGPGAGARADRAGADDAAARPAGPGDLAREWSEVVRPSLRGLTRALFAPVELVGERPGAITLAAPNAAHQARCVEQLATVQRAWLDATGRTIDIDWQAAADVGAAGTTPAAPRPGPSDAPAAAAEPGAGADTGADADEIDESRPALSGAASALDRVAEAFPGATRIDPPAGPA